MGKGGAKLTKLKTSVIKKWNSFSNLRRSFSDTSTSKIAAKISSDSSPGHLLRLVYVGKSRRRYLVSTEVIENPVFRELVSTDRDEHANAAPAPAPAAVIVECEVVLFEHLLWMLENFTESAPESLHEFAQYYSCA